jgi:hypothetical protein
MLLCSPSTFELLTRIATPFARNKLDETSQKMTGSQELVQGMSLRNALPVEDIYFPHYSDNGVLKSH